MQLDDWITEIGIDRAATILRVSRHTVKAWKHRHRKPRTTTATLIEKRTKGVVTFRECYKK